MDYIYYIFLYQNDNLFALQVKKGQSLFVNAVILQSTHFLAQADQKGTCILINWGPCG